MKRQQQKGQTRGPAEHNVRDLIIAAADQYFRRYGYEKTTITELASEIGFSKAYIYKFFDSKQAVGNAICEKCLASILDKIRSAIADRSTMRGALIACADTIVAEGTKLFFSEKGLYDMAANAAMHRWNSYVRYENDLIAIIREILLRGRNNGEFESTSRIERTCRAIVRVLQPFYNPVMLQYALADLPQASTEVIALVLRSLKCGTELRTPPK